MWGAILAAYLLVVQATLAGLTLGAYAAPGHPDLFTDMLCAPSDHGDYTAPGDTQHHRVPACCVVGCAMFEGGTAPAPEAVRLETPRAAQASLPDGPAADAVAPAPELSLRTTRAPPLTA